MHAWIDEVVGLGVRRPGYPADTQTEEFLLAQFRALGLDKVRFEPVECGYWEDHDAQLTIDCLGDKLPGPVECFAVPFSEPATVEGPLRLFDPTKPDQVRGAIAVCEVNLLEVPALMPVLTRPTEPDPDPDADPRDAPLRDAGWCYDPEATLSNTTHRLPFAPEIHDTMQAAINAGAIGYIGIIRGLPGGGCHYYVPYDADPRPIPGVYISETDRARVCTAAANPDSRAKLVVDATRATTASRNIVGELPGADDEWVIVGTHHDAPWASAVEDGTGIALLLAQARAWAKVPQSQRPHHLMFVATAAHMADGAGTKAFIDAHSDHMDTTVLEVHLEHAALDTDADANPKEGLVTPRWWFTSEIPALERSVWDAINTENLDRSLIVTPTALGARPTTDGGHFHDIGVPLVNHLAAPWYLFDPRDTLDKVDVDGLNAISRAAWTIINDTTGVTAAAMRAGTRSPTIRPA